MHGQHCHHSITAPELLLESRSRLTRRRQGVGIGLLIAIQEWWGVIARERQWLVPEQGLSMIGDVQGPQLRIVAPFVGVDGAADDSNGVIRSRQSRTSYRP